MWSNFANTKMSTLPTFLYYGKTRTKNVKFMFQLILHIHLSCGVECLFLRRALPFQSYHDLFVSCDRHLIRRKKISFVYRYYQMHRFVYLLKRGPMWFCVPFKKRPSVVLWSCLYVMLKRAKIPLTKTVTLTVRVSVAVQC